MSRLIRDFSSRNADSWHGVTCIFRSDYFGGNAAQAEGVRSSVHCGSVFVQNEVEITPRIKLVGGLRMDERFARSRAIAPRFALIATPDQSTNVKLLYGEAYRSPSAAEADIDGGFYAVNHSLRPERIATWEMVVERRLIPPLMVGVSAYQYTIHDLIEQIGSDTADGRIWQFETHSRRGLEASVTSTCEQPCTSSRMVTVAVDTR